MPSLDTGRLRPRENAPARRRPVIGWAGPPPAGRPVAP